MSGGAPVHRILVVLEAGREPEAVVREALALARTCHADIVLGAVFPATVPDVLLAAVRRVDGAAGVIALDPGALHDTLPAAVRRERCDLVVMSQNGGRRFGGASLGGARALLREGCRVLLVPPTAEVLS